MKKIDLMNAKRRIENGESIRSVARSLGVHHSTLLYYRKQNWEQIKTTKRQPIDPETWKEHYSYLLGLYLGDGHISDMGRSYRLRITLDSIYPEIIRQAVESLEYVLSDNKTSIHDIKASRAINVVVYSNRLPVLFPQHGEGVKHERDVSLMFWQVNILQHEPFVRGLIHSDGSRFIRTINNKYHYPSYDFTNTSRHILATAYWALKKIGVRPTMSRKNKTQYRLTVDKRNNVAILDSIGCTKE